MNTEDKLKHSLIVNLIAVELTIEYLKRQNLINAKVLREVKKLNKKDGK